MRPLRFTLVVLTIMTAIIAIEAIRPSPDRNTIFAPGLVEDPFEGIKIGTSATSFENHLGMPLFIANDGQGYAYWHYFAPEEHSQSHGSSLYDY